ncbi:Uncharacterised protein [Mycobacteroides abscessus subsp. abscessus]|nr:Uncharacterised protein [Mycobacteroides abscessus subsp. abscessus]
MPASTRNTPSAQSALLVIWLPQVSETSESLMASMDGLPSGPFGANLSNSALCSFEDCSLSSFSVRI